MRQLLLSLALIPTVCIPAETFMCYRNPQVEAAFKYQLEQEKCLATMIYGEARGEDDLGKIAVAYSALNRSIGKTICEVVLAPKQYSVFNDNAELKLVALNLDVEPGQKNNIDSYSWERSKHIASVVLQGKTQDPTGGATHYIADRVMKIKGYKYPKWSRKYKQVAEIGNHRFFKDNNNL